jgi:hypothetical protein
VFLVTAPPSYCSVVFLHFSSSLLSAVKTLNLFVAHRDERDADDGHRRRRRRRRLRRTSMYNQFSFIGR